MMLEKAGKKKFSELLCGQQFHVEAERRSHRAPVQSQTLMAALRNGVPRTQ